MKIAFLNLCHTDPQLVARVTNKLTAKIDFDMYIHVDLKTDIEPFKQALQGNLQAHFISNRQKVYWGGFNAVIATIEMFKQALASPKNYDYYVILQNLDYPIRSNDYISEFFQKSIGTEYIRGCKISNTKDWHYSRKYKIYNQRDDDFYLAGHGKFRKYLRYIKLMLKSARTIFSNGVIKENDQLFDIYYGTAQFAVTRSCAEYLVSFYANHPKYNEIMKHVQFPDEEYFHTIVHNSPYKFKCSKFDEPEQRWLVNWRNLHYFEYPREITLLKLEHYDNIINQDSLFIRKVRTKDSDSLMDKIDIETTI